MAGDETKPFWQGLWIIAIRREEIEEQEEEEFKKWEDENDQGDDDWKVSLHYQSPIQRILYVLQVCGSETLIFWQNGNGDDDGGEGVYDEGAHGRGNAADAPDPTSKSGGI